MTNKEEEPKKKFCLFCDGSVAEIIGIPRETIDEDGIRQVIFNLRPRPSVLRKYPLRFPEDFDNLQNQTVKRAYYLIDTLPLGESPINKRYLKLAKMMEELSYALKPMMGEGKFLEFKNELKEFSISNRALLGVMKITNDPQTEFQYLVFNDFNGLPTKVSNVFSDFTNTIKNYEKRINTLEGANAQALDDVKTSRTEILERLKQNKEESNILGEKRNYETQPSNEELASRDQSY
jgi:hypothetical protein